MGQLIYIVVSVLASLLCIVFFGHDRRDGVRQQAKGFPAGKPGKGPQSYQGEPQ